MRGCMSTCVCAYMCVCAALTINNHLDGPKVDLSPGHHTRLTCVHAFVGLLDASDLQVGVLHDLEAH